MFKRQTVTATLPIFLFTMFCLLFAAVSAQAQTARRAKANEAPKPDHVGMIYASRKAKEERKAAFSPCDVLNQGGTVYDPTQCDELATNGSTFLKNKAGKGGTLVMLAGQKAEWQLTSKNKEARLDGTEVLLRRKADHSIVAKAITNARGRFTLPIPADLEGEVELVTAQHSMKQKNGDNVGFCFEYLPREHHTLSCIDEPDDSYVLVLRVVQARPTRP